MEQTAVRSEIILSVENVHFTYEDGTEALKGIDMKVRRGEKLAVMGANGSGKSTLFLTLNGVRKPESGRILINGEPVVYTKKGLLEMRKKVGIVFQDPDNQLFSASVMQEISFGAMNLGIPESEVRARVESVMEELDITGFREKPTHFLSGGQKKRVSIADILVMDPEIIILDEPAAALDPKHARVIDHIIDQLGKRGITVILSTHDVNRALVWADRLVLLDNGRVIGDGIPEEIFRNEEVLTRTNLEKPAVLKIFETLCETGVLDRKLPMPRTTGELERYIREGTK
jgi:cobalt transport protein ATP-binding subunit